MSSAPGQYTAKTTKMQCGSCRRNEGQPRLPLGPLGAAEIAESTQGLFRAVTTKRRLNDAAGADRRSPNLSEPSNNLLRAAH